MRTGEYFHKNSKNNNFNLKLIREVSSVKSQTIFFVGKINDVQRMQIEKFNWDQTLNC